jgi:hypothetical protein
VIADEVSG